MDDNESLQIQKRLAYAGVYVTAGLSIGAAIFSVGLAILFSLGPYLVETERTGFTPFEQSVFNSQLSASHYFIYVGLSMMGITVFGSLVGIKNLKLKSQATLSASSVSSQNDSISNSSDLTYVQGAPHDIPRH